MKRIICILFAITAATPAVAQMSVTTLGATHGAACYENARDDFSQDTSPCDKALRDGAVTRSDKMKTYVNRGIIYNRTGDLQAAIDDFDAALEINNGIGEAYLNRGNSYFLAALYDNALGDYQRSLELDVNKPWAAWYNIGLVHDAKKQPDKAREAYEKALELNPDFTLAQMKLENHQ